MDKKTLLLLAVSIIFLLALFVSSFYGGQQGKQMNDTYYDEQYGKMNGTLNLTISTNKSQVTKDETFDIYLKLSNSGDTTMNVWKMEEQISYNIYFHDSNVSEVPYEGGVISRPPLTDEDLVELSPGKFIEATFDSRAWDLDEGEYTISAVYETSTGEDITKPYWLGSVESNEVTIVVQ